MLDSNGNQLFHQDCIRIAFGISNQCLAWFSKSMQKLKVQPTEFILKQDLDAHRHIDIVMPNNCEQYTKEWLDSLPEDSEVDCVTHPMCHGNANKNYNAKSNEILQLFLKFVDTNSSSNGHKEGSHCKTFYFDQKFT